MKNPKSRPGNQSARKAHPADTVIHLRVTRITKEEWKTKAQAAGLSLSAWIDRACSVAIANKNARPV